MHYNNVRNDYLLPFIYWTTIVVELSGRGNKSEICSYPKAQAKSSNKIERACFPHNFGHFMVLRKKGPPGAEAASLTLLVDVN